MGPRNDVKSKERACKESASERAPGEVMARAQRMLQKYDSERASYKPTCVHTGGLLA